MSEQVYDEAEGTAPAPAANGELVQWGEPKPLRIGPAGMSATAVAAFTLGVVTTVVVLALMHWLGPERIVTVEAGRRRG